jgi:CheY-like chemotaxis protein
MLAQKRLSEPSYPTHEPPRILLLVDDGEKRGLLAAALRDTGYEVVQSTDDACDERADYDLILADGDHPVPGPVPTLLLPKSFDVVDIEMAVLDLLAWDGPPTVRRAPVWTVLG